ncbi:MAG: winged helix-turn-helix transcriptional regulator [Acidimicrobiales bacterium]
MRSYHQFCPMAAALDAIGERWALLVVRELILGPRAFTQLVAALPGIGTDILTARLRRLEDTSVIERLGTGRRRHYGLTDDGHALQATLAELARWGASRLPPPSRLDDVRTRTALTALLIDPPPLPTEVDGHYEIRADDETARIIVTDGKLTVDPTDPSSPQTRSDSPQTIIELTAPGLRALAAGARASQLIQDRQLAITGQRRQTRALIDRLAGPAALTQALRGHA